MLRLVSCRHFTIYSPLAQALMVVLLKYHPAQYSRGRLGVTKLRLGGQLLTSGHLNLPYLHYPRPENTHSSRCLTDSAAVLSSLGSLPAGLHIVVSYAVHPSPKIVLNTTHIQASQRPQYIKQITCSSTYSR